VNEIKSGASDDPITSREHALRHIIVELQKENNALRELLVQAGYIVTYFNGDIAICRDPWHQSKEAKP
jgi:hypothetical protein